jgi:hypothetical protein
MNKQVFIYSVKIWLTTIVASAVLVNLATCFPGLTNIHNPNYSEVVNRVLLRIAKSAAGNAITMIPMGVAYYFTMIFLYKKAVFRAHFKLYVVITGVVFANFPDGILFSYLLSAEISKAWLYYYLVTFGVIIVCNGIVVTICTFVYGQNILNNPGEMLLNENGE